MYIFIGIVLGCIVAGIIVGVQWSKLISVSAENKADHYVRKDSMQLLKHTDNFLYSKTEKRERPKAPPQP
ncbi:MAG: hypothetical protein K6F80_03580 [Oscillospiraceae bacterium]|nr:hypothetical protein [Oscillospiraceae bacterium]